MLELIEGCSTSHEKLAQVSCELKMYEEHEHDPHASKTLLI